MTSPDSPAPGDVSSLGAGAPLGRWVTPHSRLTHLADWVELDPDDASGYGRTICGKRTWLERPASGDERKDCWRCANGGSHWATGGAA